MKQGWEIKKLGEVCSIQMGQSPTSDTYNDKSNGLPFFQGNADFGLVHPTIRVYCNSPIRIADVNDILISVRAPIGAINIANVQCCIGRGLASIKNKDSVKQSYVYHALIANREKLISQGTGSTFKSIGKVALNDLTIPVPPLEEQERIVEELDCLSGVIEKKKQQLKELDALAQSIFYEMFGNPVENDRGWGLKKLGEIATSQIGITYKPENVSDDSEGVVVLRSGNIQESEISLDDIVRVKCPIKEDKYVKKGDILMCSRNGSYRLVGKVAMIPELRERMTYGAFMTIIRSDYQCYLFEFFKTQYFRMQLSSAQTSTINQITVKMLNDIVLTVPPLSLQQQFAEKIEKIEKQKELIRKSIEEVEMLFNSRMEYYFG